MKSRGFTLIELLVVIAIIGLLMAVLVPALRLAKVQAEGTVCLSNVNALVKCWMLYAQDNNDRLVGTMTDSTAQPACWVDQPMDVSGNRLSPANSTYEDEIRGIKAGRLFRYADNPDVYHCPSDKRFLNVPETVTGATGDGGYRSYSLVSGAGVCSASEITWLGYQPYLKLSEIRNPGSKYILLEEAEGRGMNLNSWVIKPQVANYWIDPISIWHVDSSTIGYADGHGEKQKWNEETTLDMAKKQITDYHAPGSQELEFMQRNFPFARYN